MSGRGGSKGGGGKKGYRTKATQLEAVVRDKFNSLAKLQVGSAQNMGRSSGKKGAKGGAGKKSLPDKAKQMETVIRDKVKSIAKLQNEAIFLRQKGAVLEQLLEVASEVAVHKREHTGIKFPNLHDPQLLDFLENFLENYGGFAAERTTAQNYLNLQKLDVDQFKDVRYEDFKQKYTSLVQCLSLLLLQATDDSLKGGLTTTMDELKQLLLGTLLWSPLTFMQVGTQNLQTGDEVLADPSHSDQAITGIQLTPEQEDVLVIIGDLYNTQVATLEATHNNLSQSLDAELLQGTSDTGGVAATIMRISSNMHRLLAIHQLFHIAIMHNLADQQLAHLCVRCFPRFPRMQDLLNALVRIRENRGKGLDLPEPPGHSTGRGLALGINLQGNAAKLKPPALEPSVLSKGRLAEAGSKLLQSSSGMLSNGSAGAAVKDEAKSVGGGLGDFEPVGDAAATAEQAVPKSPMADVVKSSGKDGWDAQSYEGGSMTPVKPDGSGMLAAPGSSQKRPRSPTPVAAGSNRMGSCSGSKPAKKVSTTGGDMGTGYGAVSSSAQGSRRSKEGAPGKDSRDGIDVNMAVVAAAAAAGMPVDPAAAAALPVPLEHFPAPQQRPSNGMGQQGGLTSMHIQQLAAHLNAAGGPQDMASMLESQPKLMMLLQQRPELMGELQEAMQQQAQQAGMADYAAAQHVAALQAQGMQHQHGYQAAGRASADGLTQQPWQQAGFQGSGRSSGMPALEMLPPSLVPKDTSGTTPMQALLHSLSTLLQSCTSVQEAASAAIDMGQAEFVLSAVSAAEAAFATAVKGLADIKARCNRGYSSSAAAAAAAAGHAAGVMGPALASGMGASLHPAGAGSSRLQPPAGIPVPGPHAAQQTLPQSVSVALSGLHSAEMPPTQSTSALLAGMGLSQGLSSVSQLLMQQQQQAGRGSRQQGYAAAGTSAPGSGPNSAGRGSAAADTQQVSVSMVQQQLSTIKDNPSAIAQLVQILDQQQQLTPEVSSVLAQWMTNTSSLGQSAAVAPAAASAPADTMSSIAALMQQIQQQQQQQQAGVKQVPSSAAMAAAAAAAQGGKGAGGFGPWGGPGKQSEGLSAYDAAAAAAGYHAPSSMALGQAVGVSREMLLGAVLTDPAAAAAAAGPACMPPVSVPAPGAAAEGAAKGTNKTKEDSPSAGSSATNTGQSGMQQEGQPGPSIPAAAATAAQAVRQAGVDQQQQQQLEGIARAAAAAMTGQLQASGQADALLSTVLQLLQGQVGADGASSNIGAVAASLLQAMTASGAAGGPTAPLPLPQQQLQPHHGLAAAAGADASTTMGQSSQQPLGQSAAAAATMIPPAAAAAMAAKKAAASARQPASDFADMEVDAVSALEMLAAAAVAEGPQRKRGGNRDR